MAGGFGIACWRQCSTYEGKNLVIAAIEKKAIETKVYNFAVEDYHTYYVTGLNILVHNSIGPCDNDVLKGATKTRGLWKLTDEKASAIKRHNTWGKFYKGPDGLWWAEDITKHGASRFKVFKEGSKGLEWIHNADEFGDFIKSQHKSSTGTFISWGQLKTIK